MREKTQIVRSRLMGRVPAVATQILLITGLGALLFAPSLSAPTEYTVAPYAAEPPAAPTNIVCPPAPTNTLGVAHVVAPQSETLIASTAVTEVSAYILQAAAAPAVGNENSSSSRGPSDSDDLREMPLTEDNGIRRTDSVPSTITTQMSQGKTQHSTAVAFSAAPQGDLRALTAGECMAPRSSAVLVGGSTEVGCSTALTLSNPSAAPITVSLQLQGSTGTIDMPAHGDVLVPAYSTQQLLLESAALRDPRVALTMTTDAGTLGAWLTTSCLSGETPAGTSIIAPGARPSTHVLIPGLTMTQADADRQGMSADHGPVLRIANTSQKQAHVSVQVLATDDEHPLPGGDNIEIAPQAVTDISLNAMPAGDYALLLTSDQPIAGAVKLIREGKPYPQAKSPLLTDMTWIHSATDDPHILMNPEPKGVPGVETSAHATIANSSDNPIILTLSPMLDAAGSSAASETAEPIDVLIGSHRVKTLDLDPSIRAYAVTVNAGSSTTDEGAPTLGVNVLLTATTADPMPGELLASFQALSTQDHVASESFVPAP
ncbi:DUF5719 family protein [Actinomyces vulturis]|uniref:DUF5719 family protein n=1 Tax=Actinomyces vulturis TaxID=1857645 RepID=UPI000834C88C|nr:DUF5719 family protein [Actinomyces vulturis]